MKLLNKQLLHDFKKIYTDARSQIESWQAEVEAAEWNTPHDVKRRYPKVSLPGNRQAIFNICGNKYRLWVVINYKNSIVLIKKVGTHKEYDNWKIN